MSAAHANRSGGLLVYLDGATIRALPPWIRRFLARCHPKRVIRVPLPMTGPELRDRDRTIRREHWENRAQGIGWEASVSILRRRHGVSRATVTRIIRRKHFHVPGAPSLTDVTQ